MTLVPQGDRIIFRPDPSEEKTPMGIIIPTQKQMDTGLVEALNPHFDYEEEFGVALSVGDRIQLDRGARRDSAGEGIYFVSARNIAMKLS